MYVFPYQPEVVKKKDSYTALFLLRAAKSKK